MSQTCSICLDELNTDNHNVNIQPCGHMFHYICIAKWNRNCPLCRKPLVIHNLFEENKEPEYYQQRKNSILTRKMHVVEHMSVNYPHITPLYRAQVKILEDIIDALIADIMRQQTH